MFTEIPILKRKLWAYAILGLIGFVPFFFLWKHGRQATPWYFGALSGLVASILTPSVLQTDQVRYIWDGIMSNNGISPYAYAPKSAPSFSMFWGHPLVNHNELPTIYPPIAQILFQISSYLNPYFWNSYLGWTWAPYLEISNDWQMELGWKLMSGLFVASTIYFLRHKRWDLLVLHPLYLMTAIGNAHIDLVLVGFLAAGFHTAQKKGFWIHNLGIVSLTLAILTKWTPLLFLSVFLKKSIKELGLQKSLISYLALFIFSLGLCIWYAIRAEGNFFFSLLVYLEKWQFFAYFYRFILDVTSQFTDHYIYEWARLFSFTGFLFFFVWIHYIYLKDRISARLACLFLYFIFLCFFTTLHPWYFHTLLLVWIPYHRVFITPPIWAALAITSKIFYVERTDPFLIRITVYSLVTLTIIRDFRIFLNNQKGFQTAAKPQKTIFSRFSR